MKRLFPGARLLKTFLAAAERGHLGVSGSMDIPLAVNVRGRECIGERLSTIFPRPLEVAVAA